MQNIPYTTCDIVSHSGPVKLTVFGPHADWACDQVRRISYDLHAVQTAVIHVGPNFLVIERPCCSVELSFFVQCYRYNDAEDEAAPDLEVLDYFPTHL